jgi:hypothetical protein
MTARDEGELTFHFPDDWKHSPYDQWSFYKNRFSKCREGLKAVDILAIDPRQESLWLIEVKDYRRNRRDKDISPWEETVLKVLDTLSGLVAAKMDTTHEENQFAVDCLNTNRLRVVLHLEQATKPSKLFPRPYDPSKIQQKLKQLIKAVDAHPRVTEMAALGYVSWNVSQRTAI